MTMTRAEAAALWEANAGTWTRHARAGYDVYRDHVNTPAFLAMLPPVAGLRRLDIGCGEGGNTRAVVRPGAQVTALDLPLPPPRAGGGRGEAARHPVRTRRHGLHALRGRGVSLRHRLHVGSDAAAAEQVRGLTRHPGPNGRGDCVDVRVKDVGPAPYRTTIKSAFGAGRCDPVSYAGKFWTWRLAPKVRWQRTTLCSAEVAAA